MNMPPQSTPHNHEKMMFNMQVLNATHARPRCPIKKLFNFTCISRGRGGAKTNFVWIVLIFSLWSPERISLTFTVEYDLLSPASLG